MKILLTGGAGYIGSHAAIALCDSGHEVILYDNFCNSNKEVLTRLKKILKISLKCIEGDVRDTALLAKTLSDNKIDFVFHFAGLKAVGESNNVPIEYYANNVQGTVSLLEAMKRVNLNSLVFSSSATVYGDPIYLPIDEKHQTTAKNPYGRSKLFVEEMLKDLSNSDPAWRICCLRYFNPVGTHNSHLIGEEPNGIANNLLPYIARVALRKAPYLNVYGNDYDTEDGTGVRDYIHVMDLADGHLAALNFLNKKNGFHEFNLGTGKGISVLEMVKKFEIVSGREVPIKICPRRLGDVAACFAQSNKALNELNWSATRTLEDMCESTWIFQKNL